MKLTFLLAVFLPAQGNDEAEQLFRRMEATLDKARAIELSFEATWGEASVRNGQKLKGTLAVMNGNKLHLNVKGGEKNDTVHLRISDGAQGLLKVEAAKGKLRSETERTPKNLGANYRTVLTRSGVLLALLPPVYAKADKNYKELFSVSGFNLAGNPMQCIFPRM